MHIIPNSLWMAWVSKVVEDITEAQVVDLTN